MRSISNIDPHYKAAMYTFKNGGGTFAPHVGRPVNVSDSYVVALGKGSEQSIDLMGCESHDRSVIRKAINQFTHDRRPQWNEGYFLGTWIDNNVLYLDVVELFNNQSDAHTAAIERGQCAYYDGINRISRRVGAKVVTS